MSLGLREYARHRKAAGLPGGTLRAVQVAIRDHRLKASLTKAGKIRSASAADAEWAASTRSEMVPLSGPTAPKAPAPRADEVAAGREPPIDFNEARARNEAAKAQLAEIQLAEKRGELVPAADVERRIVAVFSSCRTKLMGVPARVRQRDPALTTDQLALIEESIREACEDLATHAAEVVGDDEETGG